MKDYIIILYIELIAAWRYFIPVVLVAIIISVQKKRGVLIGILIVLLILLCTAAYQFETYK